MDRGSSRMVFCRPNRRYNRISSRKKFFDKKVDNQKGFEISLLILSSMVIKSDGKVLKTELNYVKQFFTKTFGLQKSNESLKFSIL